MTKPTTQFVLVRTPRIDNKMEVILLKEYGQGFDFSEYSFLRMNPNSSMEEWVPTAELHLYERAN